MMMGGMGGSGGSMGMDMMNMGSNMGSSGMGNMAGMSGSGSMAGMSMQGMPMQGMSMQGMPMQGMSMQGMPMQGMNNSAMYGMADPNAMSGVNTGAAGSLFGAGGFNSLIGTLLNLAIDIFAILLVVGLVVGAVVLIKRYLFEGEFFAPKTKAACSNCGQALSAEWHCCPKCGQPKAAAQPVVAPQTV